MKLLKDILYKSRISEVIGSTNVAIEKVHFDSRAVEPMSVFVAVKGTTSDGHAFIDSAIEKGAAAVVCEQMPKSINQAVTYVKVVDSAASLAFIAANFYDNPSEKLKLVGITGTNGKTSIATMLHELYSRLNYKSGMLSTVVNKVGTREFKATHTTGDAVSVNKLLNQMVEEGCDYCFMEVSSHALDQQRVAGLCFHQAVFTNITHDHLDYHETFNNYIAAKKKLFDTMCTDSVAVLNKDDRHWMQLIKNSPARVMTYSLKSAADFKGKLIENSLFGLHLMINKHEFWSKLVGEFNASNLLAVYGVAIADGQDEISVLTELSSVQPAPGRFQQVSADSGIMGVVDYAHTPDALQNVLDTINNIRTGNEAVVTVVGCGGDRDKNKRPAMARIAGKLSDRLIITSDNPRSEDPQVIVDEMVAGLDPNMKRKAITIIDRKEAIKTAVAMADSGDIVLVAGKGHEKYQEIKGVKQPFDDVAILEELLNQTQL